MHTLPAVPSGHWSHKIEPAALGTYASLTYDPGQPRHVRAYHSRLLHGSLSRLAAMVGSIATRPANPGGE